MLRFFSFWYLYFPPQKALNVVQMCNEDQERVFKMLAAILWLGNISFKVNDNENHIEVVNDEGRIHNLCIMFLNGLFTPYHILCVLIWWPDYLNLFGRISIMLIDICC